MNDTKASTNKKETHTFIRLLFAIEEWILHRTIHLRQKEKNLQSPNFGRILVNMPRKIMWLFDFKHRVHEPFIHLVFIICNKQRFELSHAAWPRHNKYTSQQKQQYNDKIQRDIRDGTWTTTQQCKMSTIFRLKNILENYSDQRLNFVRLTKLTLLERNKQCSGRYAIYTSSVWLVCCVILNIEVCKCISRCIFQLSHE